MMLRTDKFGRTIGGGKGDIKEFVLVDLDRYERLVNVVDEHEEGQRREFSQQQQQLIEREKADIVSFLGKNEQKRGAKILDIILQSPELINWDRKDGALIYNGQKIPNSNIRDLLKVTLSPMYSHVTKLPGQKQFYLALKQLYVPDLLLPPRLRKYLGSATPAAKMTSQYGGGGGRSQTNKARTNCDYYRGRRGGRGRDTTARNPPGPPGPPFVDTAGGGGAAGTAAAAGGHYQQTQSISTPMMNSTQVRGYVNSAAAEVCAHNYNFSQNANMTSEISEPPPDQSSDPGQQRSHQQRSHQQRSHQQRSHQQPQEETESSSRKSTVDKTLKSIYYDVSKAGSYSSIGRLYNVARKQIPDLKREDVREFLRHQPPYTLHRKRNLHFPRSRVIAEGVGQEYDLDLADFSKFQSQNKHTRFLIILIDIFSRKAFVEPLTKKDTGHVVRGMEEIFKRMATLPQSIRHDKGGEFENAQFRKLLKDNDINNFSAVGRLKANYAERFIRTLREKIAAYMTYKRTRVYLPVLQKIVNSYNNSEHSSIGMAPSEVTKENEPLVWVNNYHATTTGLERQKGPLKPKYWFKIGARVRHIIDKHVLSKGYTDNWSNEVFVIVQRYRRDNIPVYRLEDHGGNQLKRWFYNEELQAVGQDQDRIRDIVDQKTSRGVKFYLVRWFDRGTADDTWLTREELNDYDIAQSAADADAPAVTNADAAVHDDDESVSKRTRSALASTNSPNASQP